ncbi:collagen-like protein [Pseudomonas sp. LS44]|uniref:collagen-like protein n=1 Tax=Pseudomonas sp. LS44 TaxID=1357074 RepID=UPI00215ACB1F|nr:collagen-like protein [Pseudomonas sp. LS44]UVE18854.1 collagen-like protein [Pseudomonas sp. LS44]
MRSLLMLALLSSPVIAAAAEVKVESNTLLRLPANTSLMVLERLEIADAGVLLIPATVNELRVGELRLGRDARIGIAPGEQAFRLEAKHAELAAGIQISAHGASGKVDKPATPGRNLSVRLEQVSLSGTLLVDVHGGAGAPGLPGLDGAAGETAGCLWGQAGPGSDGQNGSDGQTGAAGGQVRLEVPESFPVDALQVRREGGAGGLAGEAGRAGPGASPKGCLLYSSDGARDGRSGQPGQPGAAGREGSVNVVRFADQSGAVSRSE